MYQTVFIALTLAASAAFALSLGVLYYEWLFRYRIAVRERVKGISKQPDSHQTVSLFKDIKRLQNRDFMRQTWSEWLRQQIELTGSTWSNTMFLLCCLACGVVAASVGSLWFWWLGAALGIAGMLSPFGVLMVCTQRRQKLMSRQLPEAFSMISRAVKAGQTIPSALQIVATDFEPPISTEFARCHEKQNLGISRESALRQLAQRAGIMELQIFVVAILVQSRSGGDLIELLDNLSGMIRKRLKLKERVRALTGEGRTQAVVLIILPVAAFVGIILTAPDYAQFLIDRPMLLVATAAAQLVGALWIRKIVNFEY